jgi:hypothetical protein
MIEVLTPDIYIELANVLPTPLISTEVKSKSILHLLRFGNNHGSLGLHSFKSTTMFPSVIHFFNTSNTSIRHRASRACKRQTNIVQI